MFRLHKSKPSKSGEKIDFKLSHLKAQQVPKGWDKLFVSVISSENGRTLAKSTKAPVRNGSCQWADTLSESIWISRDNISKEMEDCFLKLLVAMGSSRSNILGEATVCLSSYMSSSSAVPLSIPLNKCNHGTVLDVKLQCLIPSTKFRDEEPKELNPQIKGLNAKIHDVTIKSKGSDYSGAESVESSSIKDLDSTSSPGEAESRATSFSGSGSQYSYNSVDGSIGKGIFSPTINLRDDRQTPTGRQDSTSSQKSMYQGNMSNSSKNRPEAAEDTFEELRAEAKMWEMNARKLMADLDTLRTDFSDQSKNLANLAAELSAANLERDNLKNEVEQLKLFVEEPTMKQKGLEDSTFEGVRIPDIEKALKEELKFQKECNANLSLQLERSQESNIELVSVLQELEETIEQQKIEIENLSALPSKLSDLENSLQLRMKGNNDLTFQLQQLEESKKSLLVKVQQLDDALEQKKHDIVEVTVPNNKILSDIEMEYESKLSAKEEEIRSLKAKLSESLQQRCNAEPEIACRNGDEASLMREIEELKNKIQELEMDCNELTDENLDLLYKLKEAKKNSRKARASDDGSLAMLKDQCFPSFESEVCSDILENNDDHISIQELENVKIALEVRITKLSEELTGKTSEVANLEANLSSKEKEIGVLQKHQSELEAKVCHLEDEKMQLEEHMEVMLKERDVNSRCLYDLRNDLATLSQRTDSHVSANKVLQRKSSELEKRNHELELHASEVEQEKEQLSVRMSFLEAQLRDLTNERESLLSEQENSESVAARLQEEIMKVKYDMVSASENFEEKLKEMQSQWSEASQECENLRKGNQLLQTATTELTDECSSLQKLNGDLRQKNLELQEYCSLIGTRLKESDKKFIDCSERVELIEKKFVLMREDVVSKEKSLNSELDVLVDENRKHIERGQCLLNQMQIENTEEIQKLQQEIEYLSMKLSASYDEKERIASNAVLEVSALRADKAKLESSFQASNNEVINMRTEYEQKLQDTATELAAFKTNQEKLLKLVEDYKSREVKLKSTLNALELKLTVAEYEKQQLTKESGNLKNQLQQIDQFENEIMALKNDLNSTNSEKERLESALRETSELCEDLKAQKTSYDAKILTMEKEISELEDFKRSRDALEERLLQMESELKEKEASFAQNAEQKNELSHIRRINRQNEQTIQLLEREKNESLTRIQALEEELKLLKEQKRNQISKINRKGLPLHEDQKNNMMKNTSQNRSNRKKSSLKNDRENVKEDPNSNKHQSEVETDSGLLDESVYGAGVDPLSKIQLLETELAKAKEANSKYEVQLNRFMSQGQINHANGRIKSTAEGETVTKEKFERIKSMLEAELRDIQQRYLHMSLKYAEVEAQREELVMKLKAAKVKKGWLS
ncbi:hypothetical protein L6164_033758 [Bauhinia variegata]|uniref:Uncharacterized protein n=1 Tax=Bauhinia variegata TaxID=167791 RepID=A0ACB9KSR6_BAUVA|nr:hypothetical protein L6164_033758 [Bauhinia variegata]